MSDLTLDVAVAEATAADSGVDFVYRLLNRYAEQALTSDAVLVIDDARLGRQVFRSGQRSPIHSDLSLTVADGPPGIYTEGGRMAESGSSVLVQLAGMALRFDVVSREATRDGLTGLFNRRYFDDFLTQSAARSQRHGWPFALVILDVDGFKAVNDRLGHAAGDNALRVIGTEIRKALRVGDMAARIGGDEFALILHDALELGATAVLQRLKDAVVRSADGFDLRLSAGIAFAPAEGTDATSLYRMADRRMYETKRR